MKKLVGLFVGLAILFGVATSANCVTDVLDGRTLYVGGAITGEDALNIRKLTANYLIPSNKSKELHIIVDSPGGSAFAMMSMINHINRLKKAGVKVTTRMGSHGFSAGAILFIIGDVREIHAWDLIMFHEAKQMRPVNPAKPNGAMEEVPWDEMSADDRFVLNHLNAWMKERLIDIVGKKLADKLITKGKDKWLTGQEAFDLGIATKLI
jgi:ATP-dependent protease ClpP protease subunit